MDTGLIVPHMGAYCLSYESHKCLCAYLTMQKFTKEEFLEREIDYIGAGDEQFFRGLCYMSIYTNLGIDDFGKWAEISEAAVTVLGEVCGHPFSSDAEKALYAYGLAVQTFPFDQKHSQFQIDEALCEELLKLELEKPEALWAMYLTLTAFLDKMEFCQKEKRRISLFIRALKKMLSVKEAYQALKTIHYSTEKRRIVYEEECDLSAKQRYERSRGAQELSLRE